MKMTLELPAIEVDGKDVAHTATVGPKPKLIIEASVERSSSGLGYLPVKSVRVSFGEHSITVDGLGMLRAVSAFFQ